MDGVTSSMAAAIAAVTAITTRDRSASCRTGSPWDLQGPENGTDKSLLRLGLISKMPVVISCRSTYKGCLRYVHKSAW